MPLEIQSPSSMNPMSRSFPHWKNNTSQDFVTIPSLNNYVRISKSFRFQLRAEGNAHILFIFPAVSAYYHICLGDELLNNTSSAYNPENAQRRIFKTPDILSKTEFRSFWIKWSTNFVHVGREDEMDPFIIWNDPHIDFNLDNIHLGICTIDVNGTWIIDDSEFRELILSESSKELHTGCWVPGSSGNVPPGAVSGGLDNGEPQVYVARAVYRHQLIPGKLHPSDGCCYITYEGRVFACRDYEVLCSLPGQWVWLRNGENLHPNAVKSICARSGEVFYIGRSFRNGTLSIGKVFASTKLCYVGYEGREILAIEYELFVSDR